MTSKEATTMASEQFVDLLILEESFRKEYLELRILRRKYLCFFTALIIWNAYFLWRSWLEPPHNRYFLLLCRLCCLAGISTLVLFYISGLYHDTLVQARRFIPQANRALRYYNVKLIATNRGWISRFTRLKPGEGLRLIVSSKAGSIEFREAFEEYRDQYWLEVQKSVETRKTKKPARAR